MQKKQYMNFWMLVALVSGNMVGSGIFLLPSGLAKFGTISILAWIFTALGSVLLALVFCSFSRLVPKVDGGPYIYVRVGMGKFMGFQSGFGYWISLWVGNCAISLAAVGYLSFFFPILENRTVAGITAIGIIWLFTGYNMFGARTVGWLQILSMIGKGLPLLFIIFVGIWYIHPEYYLEFNRTENSSLNAISAAASLTLWAFIGLESATVTASKVKNPKKTIPLATLTGTLIAAFIYILSSTVIMGMLPAADLVNSNAPFALAAKEIIGQSGGVIIAVAAVIACLGTLNGWIMVASIVSKSIAETNLFPKIFAKQNRYGAPSFSLILSGVLMTVLLLLTMSKTLVEQFELIILMAVLTALVPYFYTTISNILVIKQQDANSPFWQTAIIIAVLACGYSFWTIVGSGQEVVYYGMILFFLGTPIYAIAEWMNLQKKTQSSF
ncbi:amino acid permease [Fastidiosibacter lacustris]|uniref:amino acid permease n=1 Tax=Fastidiosibacter lacustris TaxID=2056695 RepID=UPI00130098AE|nr:amino acid permease [Fastidiosibacter lacustris]